MLGTGAVCSLVHSFDEILHVIIPSDGRHVPGFRHMNFGTPHFFFPPSDAGSVKVHVCVYMFPAVRKKPCPLAKW